ncbi:MAG: ATP-binding protein [Desulfosarcinaceae bacterium]
MTVNGIRFFDEIEYSSNLKKKWHFIVSIFLITLLLILSAYTHANRTANSPEIVFAVLYCSVAAVFSFLLLSFSLVRRLKQPTSLTYLQLAADTFIITLLVYITGSYYSYLSFLYLVVIIFANMNLYLRGGLIIAAICTFQYALLLVLEYQMVLPAISYNFDLVSQHQAVFNVVSKALITSTACFAVAILSGLLTEQNRRTQKELKEMESHVKRVEKMAYMGEMAAGLAHEIKNPLASLVGSIQMLKDELPYSSDHRYLMEIILRETDRLSTLVTDFLFFARPPVGKPEKISLKDAVEEICALFEKDSSHAQKLSIQKQIEDKLWVLMDPVHFRQVLWNLILNAAEAIEANGRVSIAARQKKNHNIEISVEDNGCGIAPDKLTSIFDPFFTTKQKGSGLGLSIVHRILESYGSRLDVDTKLQEGTIFSFAIKPASPP